VTKAQAQLCFELLRKEVMYSFVPEIRDDGSFDPNAENMLHFKASYKDYQKRFRRFLTETPEGKQLSSEFGRWYRERGLGIVGKLRATFVLTKSIRVRIRHILKFWSHKPMRWSRKMAPKN
jgi:hypothetical protein